ncbi:hypothetical protein Rsub_08649 [Raphidocelis subcapitata]|uniref:Saposin B-type domain-containing protein n=1 Tax=Raphidocelis subcapitata TaxID=307507 RepID=A0A2V0PER2_9CHLO|nr:hypothetical protein Rsub_08649 [Raphidocelis subcapitata]|eukprot:GBF95667.1 hypothetical protein Rsub_08649 [Raphidocelis subcapitata]
MAVPRCALAACLIVLAAGSCAAQFDFGGGGGRQTPPAVRADVPFIRCGVCQHFVKQALRVLKTMREELKPGKKLEEADLIDKLEALCNAQGGDGEWLRRLDMVEEGEGIAVKDMGQLGRHTSETSTLARACAAVSEELDLSDLSEALYLGKSRAQLTQLACYDMSGACKAKPPPLPKDREPGPAFEPLSDEEAERERLMAKLAASGMGGQMFDRESLKQQMEGLQGMADEGAFGEGVQLREAAGEGKGAPGAGAGAAGEVLDRARAAAGAAVDAARDAAARAGGVLKGALGRLTGGAGGGGDAGAEL